MPVLDGFRNLTRTVGPNLAAEKAVQPRTGRAGVDSYGPQLRLRTNASIWRSPARASYFFQAG